MPDNTPNDRPGMEPDLTDQEKQDKLDWFKDRHKLQREHPHEIDPNDPDLGSHRTGENEKEIADRELEGNGGRVEQDGTQQDQ